MALLMCPECRGQVSSRAATCPHCGCPTGEGGTSEAAVRSGSVVRLSPRVQPAAPSRQDGDDRPSMVRGTPGVATVRPARTVASGASREPKALKLFRWSKLRPGEEIHAWAPATVGRAMGKGEEALRGGVVIVTDQRVPFYGKGLLNETFADVPIHRIGGVEQRSSLWSHTLTISAQGTKLVVSPVGSGLERIVQTLERLRRSGTGQSGTAEVSGGSSTQR